MYDKNITTELHLNDKSAQGQLEDLASDEVRLWFQAINFAILCEFIDVVGSGTNIINIICFCKQGFQDSMNISLLGTFVRLQYRKL